VLAQAKSEQPLLTQEHHGGAQEETPPNISALKERERLRNEGGAVAEASARNQGTAAAYSAPPRQWRASRIRARRKRRSEQRPSHEPPTQLPTASTCGREVTGEGFGPAPTGRRARVSQAGEEKQVGRQRRPRWRSTRERARLPRAGIADRTPTSPGPGALAEHNPGGRPRRWCQAGGHPCSSRSSRKTPQISPRPSPGLARRENRVRRKGDSAPPKRIAEGPTPMGRSVARA